MNHRRITSLVLISLIVSLFAVEPARAIENVRVAYPSMNTSVFCLIIAQKEGYLKEEGSRRNSSVSEARSRSERLLRVKSIFSPTPAAL